MGDGRIINPSSPAEHNGKLDLTHITTKEIKEFSLPVSPAVENVPEPVKCKFCGKTLYNEAIFFYGSVITIRKDPQRCNCKQAVEYWKEYDKKQEEIKKTERSQKERERYIKRCRIAGIDKRHMMCTFKNYKLDKNNPRQLKAFNTLKDYVVNFDKYSAEGKSLYIEGTYGTGKTHLVSAMAKSLIKKGKKVICKTPSEILIDIRDTYENNSDYVTEQDVVNQFKKVDLLIIDDFGKQKPTEWGMSIMYDILNYRYAEMLPTVVTTNFNEDELVDALSVKKEEDKVDPTKIESIISRFHQSAEVVTMAWQDYRGRE